MSDERRTQHAIKDACAALATVPRFSGAAVLVFTEGNRAAQVAVMDLPDVVLIEALRSLLEEKSRRLSPIVVPQ